MGATVVSLPASVRQKLGIANNEPMRFVFNISTTSPVLEITLGTKNGQTFLKPLAMISPQRADDLQIDYASLVIAPAGGQVGPYEYQPGISLGFAATIGGTPIDVSATLDLAGGRLLANVDVGSFTLGPVRMSETKLKLDVSPAKVLFSFRGGFEITGTPSRFSAAVDLEAAVTGTFRLQVSAEGSNIPLGLTGISIERIDLFVDINIPQLGAPIQAFAFRAEFDLDVLGAKPKVRAAMTLSNGVLTQLQALVSVPPMVVAGTGITGAGCDGVRGQGEDGVCVRIDYDIARTDSPFEFVLTGAVTVVGVSIDLTMAYDANGFKLDGTLDLVGVVKVTVSGRFYRSSSTDVVISPLGARLTPGDGDFRLSGTTELNLAGALRAEMSFAVAKVGGAAFVSGSGSVNTPVFNLSLKGTFEGGGGQGVRYSITGNGQVRLLGVSIDAGVSINQAGIELTGTLNLPLNIGSAELSGSLVYPTPTSPLLFRLSGSGRINDPFSGYPALEGSFTVANMDAQRRPSPAQLAFSAALSLPIGNAQAQLSGRVYQNASNQLAVFLQASADVTLPIVGLTSALVGFGFNNDDGRDGVWVTVVALDIRVDGRLDKNGFSVGLQLPADGGTRVLTGEVGPALWTLGFVIGGRVTYGFTGRFTGPTPLALSFNGGASVAAWVYVPPISGQPMGRNADGSPAGVNVVELAASASYPPLKGCFTLIVRVCLPPTAGPPT
jgi:hypothetical protein